MDAYGVGLAPMAGITDAAFRVICREFGCSFSVSEMISAKGFLCMPRGSSAQRDLLRKARQEDRCALQLFGHEPDVISEAVARLTHEGFQWIDLNMGCPARKIVSSGDGAALMRMPELASRILMAAVKATRLPITVKIRAGWDENSVNCVEMAKRLEDAGASAITLHARTRSQFYAGRADWSLIARVKRAVSIPVIGNGDVASGADALRMMETTGCDGVMIGRAAEGNPWIFEEALCALTGRAYEQPTIELRILTALRHLDMLASVKGERGAILEMRKNIAWYLKGARGAAQMRTKINALESFDEVRMALISLLYEKGEPKNAKDGSE